MPFPLENYTLIAPFWDNINDRVGEVWYRSLLSDSVLNRRVEDAINAAFDGGFYPESLFVVTWSNVELGSNMKRSVLYTVSVAQSL